MADGTFPGLTSRNRDLNAKDNAIYVNLTDDAGASIGVTSGALDVNIDNASIVVTATDLDIRDLDANQDNVAISDGTNTVTVDASGFLTVNVNGTVTVSATDLDIRDLDASQDSVEIKDAGGDALGINGDGSINVNILSSALSDEFHDYDTATVAGSGTSNHDYTVANTTAIVTGVYVGASGDAKFEIQVDNGGGFTTVAVAFTTGKQGDSKLVEFPTPLEATDTVRVIRTNRESQTQDVYSTIMGRDV